MTDLLPPITSPADDPPFVQPRPPFLGGMLAAGWAGLAGAIGCAALAVIGWLATTGGAASGAIRVGVDGWLVAHRVPIGLPGGSPGVLSGGGSGGLPGGGSFGLAPLGLTILLVVLLYRAGCWTGRTSVVSSAKGAVLGTLGFAVGYGLFASLVALIARDGDFGAFPPTAFLHATLFAGLAGGAGLCVTSGLARVGWSRVPSDLRTALRGGYVTMLVLLAGAAVVYLASLLAHASRVAALVGGLQPGVFGSILLFLLCLVYLPNAILFTAAYVLGPGFALGVGTTVAPTGSVLGALPAFPLFAAVPGEGTPPGWVLAVFALPFAAGVAGGLYVSRRQPLSGIEHSALCGGLAGLFGALGITALTLLAGGPAGPGRMGEMGPSTVEVGLLATMTFVVASALAAIVRPAWGLWQVHRANARSDQHTASANHPPGANPPGFAGGPHGPAGGSPSSAGGPPSSVGGPSGSVGGSSGSVGGSPSSAGGPRGSRGRRSAGADRPEHDEPPIAFD